MKLQMKEEAFIIAWSLANVFSSLRYPSRWNVVPHIELLPSDLALRFRAIWDACSQPTFPPPRSIIFLPHPAPTAIHYAPSPLATEDAEVDVVEILAELWENDSSLLDTEVAEAQVKEILADLLEGGNYGVGLVSPLREGGLLSDTLHSTRTSASRRFLVKACEPRAGGRGSWRVGGGGV